MSHTSAVISESIERDVGVAEADVALTMLDKVIYEFVSTTTCWIKQGGAWLITCVTKALSADTDFMTIAIDGASSDFELDKAGNGVTAGRVQVDISGATTAASVAAILRTAILATFTSSNLTVTDNLDGTLTVIMVGAQIAMAEHVANAGFTVAASTALAASAGSGSQLTPALQCRLIDGKFGQTLSVIRDAADGKSSLTRVRFLQK